MHLYSDYGLRLKSGWKEGPGKEGGGGGEESCCYSFRRSIDKAACSWKDSATILDRGHSGFEMLASG